MNLILKIIIKKSINKKVVNQNQYHQAVTTISKLFFYMFLKLGLIRLDLYYLYFIPYLETYDSVLTYLMSLLGQIHDCETQSDVDSINNYQTTITTVKIRIY